MYWFPASEGDFERSTLRFSRKLSLYGAHCITLVVADADGPFAQKFAIGKDVPVVVLATSEGTLVNKLDSSEQKISVAQVELLLENEINKRMGEAQTKIEGARAKLAAGDKDGAVADLQAVYMQKCLFPKIGKEAAKELKKLGIEGVAVVPTSPIFDEKESAKIVDVMDKGLAAEEHAKYKEAEHLYLKAHEMDPADPTPLRYVGELYRHHIGDWKKARETFNEILTMEPDPIARAVALHGLGKMTIHEGEFIKGKELMEQSVTVYPLAIACRNLAVYWNSEGDAAKAEKYAKQAMQLDHGDPFNMVFGAVFMAKAGHKDEALNIAKEYESLLPASYNLAAIYAQCGQRDKALELLKRHFYQYEATDSVRSKEMMEARVDAVFASIVKDPDFLALTAGADNRLPMPSMSEKASQ
jgi:tetratricopeptide (TPR) repeat protein